MPLPHPHSKLLPRNTRGTPTSPAVPGEHGDPPTPPVARDSRLQLPWAIPQAHALAPDCPSAHPQGPAPRPPKFEYPRPRDLGQAPPAHLPRDSCAPPTSPPPSWHAARWRGCGGGPGAQAGPLGPCLPPPWPPPPGYQAACLPPVRRQGKERQGGARCAGEAPPTPPSARRTSSARSRVRGAPRARLHDPESPGWTQPPATSAERPRALTWLPARPGGVRPACSVPGAAAGGVTYLAAGKEAWLWAPAPGLALPSV